MSNDIPIVKRKKDFVTALAMFLFLILIISELVLVFYIPTQYKRSNWVTSTAKAELIEKIDSLRKGLISLDKSLTSQDKKHEIKLVRDVLNDHAGYLKEHKDSISFRQVNMLQREILLFNNYYVKWRSQNFLIKPIQLNLTSYKNEQLLKNGCHSFVTTNKKGSK